MHLWVPGGLRTLAGGTRLVGHLGQGVPPLTEPSRLIGRQQVGRVVLAVGLLRLDALVDGRLHHVAGRRGGGLAQDGGRRQGVHQTAVHLDGRGRCERGREKKRKKSGVSRVSSSLSEHTNTHRSMFSTCAGREKAAGDSEGFLVSSIFPKQFSFHLECVCDPHGTYTLRLSERVCVGLVVEGGDRGMQAQEVSAV